MATETRSLTADELWRPCSNRTSELVRGEVREMKPPGGEHRSIRLAIGVILRSYAQARGGQALGEAGFVLSRNPDVVRAPDVSYGSAEQVPATGRDTLWPGAPGLAVEIVSPNDPPSEVERKAHEYLAAGARWVWVVYLATSSIAVCRPGGQARVDDAGTSIIADDAPPGPALPVSEVMAASGASRWRCRLWRARG